MLFLSCDLVNSTRYKQESKSDWQESFLAFYYRFTDIVHGLTNHKDYLGTQLRLWKAVGDELIFTTDVRKESDIFNAVQVWLKALKDFETDELSPDNFKVKGGAFIATFQGPDFESSIPKRPHVVETVKRFSEINQEVLVERNEADYLFDYFGPSVDTGFRIFTQSDERHFTMALEVTWAIVSELKNRGEEHLPSEIVYRGSYPLKGVWNGREYPIFAFDRHWQQPVNAAMRELFPSPMKIDAVSKLCKECRDDDDWKTTVYLPDSTNPDLAEMAPPTLERIVDTTLEGFESLPAENSGSSEEKNPADFEKLLEERTAD